MRFLKVLCTLILFVWGSGHSTFASIDFTSVDFEEQEAFLPDFEEGRSFSYDSTIPVLPGFQNLSVFHQEDFDFRFHSFYKSRLAAGYLIFCRSIIPGLDIPDIIYPFHSFL